MSSETRPPVDDCPALVAYPAEPIRWAELFGNDHPVEVEVGPGKGLFLANASARRPGHNFLGIEIARKYARKAAERVWKLGQENVRLMAGDAGRFLRHFTPEASVVTVHVYFPDPWWKKRHKKRRVFNDGFVNDAARVLKPAGELHIATDVEEYYGVMTELMAGHPEFVRLPDPEPNEPEHDLDYLTNFERKYRLEGRPIYRAEYRLREVPGGVEAPSDA